MRDLIQIAEFHGTDKFEHGYMPYYQKYLPLHIKSMLEIGCFKGASATMWREVYGSDARIAILDLFEDPRNASQEQMHDLGFATYKGNQADLVRLHSIEEKFDVIIDDGSHRADHQLISLYHLFTRNLNPGGVYVIEDLHCCLEEFYRGQVKSLNDTALKFIEGIESNVFFNEFLSTQQVSVLSKQIESAKLFDNKIGFIFKKL